MNKRRILVIADTHVGSMFGLWHPEYIPYDREPIPLNGPQKVLWKYWRDMVGEVTSNPCDFAVINGDAVDGLQIKDNGVESVSTNMDDQRECFLKLFRMIPLKKGKNVYVTVGSDYHELRGAKVHRQIASELTKNGNKYFLNVGGIIDMEGWKIDFSHGSTQAWIYLEQALAREMSFAQVAAALKKYPLVDAIIMAHVHKSTQITMPGAKQHLFKGLLSPAVVTSKIATVGCFQTTTSYARKKSRKLIHDLGYMVIEIDDEGIHIKERLFPPILIAEKIRRE